MKDINKLVLMILSINKKIGCYLVLGLSMLGQQAFALPPSTFTSFTVGFTKLNNITGSVENGMLLGAAAAANFPILIVNGVSYPVPAGTNFVLQIKQPVLAASPYCSPLIIKKKEGDDIVSAIAPFTSTPALYISSYNNSINGTFTLIGSTWKFVLASINPVYTNSYPGYVPLQCNN